MKFNALKLSPAIIETLDNLGFEEATPIQAEAIPLALMGEDLMGQAQTGTGKTAAFGLPILEQIQTGDNQLQALIIAPTRELAMQVQEELFQLGRGSRSKVYAVYGGYPIGKQIERIKRGRPDIIVGTPGRLLDLMRRKVLDASQLKFLVLDEADEMLNMGFIDDIRAIVQQTPSSRQTMLFSATLPDEVKQLGQEFLRQPKLVKIEAKQLTADLIDQYFVKCSDQEKFDILTRMLDVHAPSKAIVFCRTKKRVDEIGRGLSLRGYDAELIHGDVTQQKRSSVMKEFKTGGLELLVATDVAARGLDISGVSHVYNYDIPQDPESYVHRIGRTGRAGQEGVSITFVMHNEMAYLRTIESMTKIQMTPMRPPTDKEAEAGQVQHLIDNLNQSLADKEVDSYRNTAKMLLNHYESNDLVAGLLNELINANTAVEVTISPQKPLPRHHTSRSGSGMQGNSKQRSGQRQKGQGNSSKRKNQGKQAKSKRNHAEISTPKKAKTKVSKNQGKQSNKPKLKQETKSNKQASSKSKKSRSVKKSDHKKQNFTIRKNKT